MTQHAQLQAESRILLGKKVRRLRTDGILPATVYGHNVTPTSIQLNARDFRAVLKQSGRTQLIDLIIDGQRARPVFVKQTTVDAKRNALLHIEFYQANLLEKVHSRVPVHFTGESQGVKDGGILLTVIDHLDVECLPDDVPEAVNFDLSMLPEINSQVHVSDLTLPPEVAVLTPADEIVAKVNAPVSEESLEEAIADTLPLPTELGGDNLPPAAVPES